MHVAKLILLDLTGCWEAPLGSDAHRPEPMAGCSFSKVDQHRALLFGGRTCVKRVNEMFLFDLDNRVRPLLVQSMQIPR